MYRIIRATRGFQRIFQRKRPVFTCQMRRIPNFNFSSDNDPNNQNKNDEKQNERMNWNKETNYEPHLSKESKLTKLKIEIRKLNSDILKGNLLKDFDEVFEKFEKLIEQNSKNTDLYPEVLCLLFLKFDDIFPEILEDMKYMEQRKELLYLLKINQFDFKSLYLMRILFSTFNKFYMNYKSQIDKNEKKMKKSGYINDFEDLKEAYDEFKDIITGFSTFVNSNSNLANLLNFADFESKSQVYVTENFEFSEELDKKRNRNYELSNFELSLISEIEFKIFEYFMIDDFLESVDQELNFKKLFSKSHYLIEKNKQFFEGNHLQILNCILGFYKTELKNKYDFDDDQIDTFISKLWIKEYNNDFLKMLKEEIKKNKEQLFLQIEKFNHNKDYDNFYKYKKYSDFISNINSEKIKNIYEKNMEKEKDKTDSDKKHTKNKNEYKNDDEQSKKEISEIQKLIYNIVMLYFLMQIINAAMIYIFGQKLKSNENVITYSDFIQKLNENEIEKIEISQPHLTNKFIKKQGLNQIYVKIKGTRTKKILKVFSVNNFLENLEVMQRQSMNKDESEFVRVEFLRNYKSKSL